MACSKLFPGDLPELISEIIQYFRNDFSTLHSCILVNRLWCRLAIPLLWEDPFSTPTKNCRLIEIFLSNLNGVDKTKLLNEHEIDDKIFLSDVLFNYPSFIKYLNTWKIIVLIKKWATTAKTSYPYFDDLVRLVYVLLLKMFIKYEVKLHTLEFRLTCWNFEFFNNTFELILQNPNFISNIKDLKLYINTNIAKIFPFLKFLYSNCSSISSFYFQYPIFYGDIEKYLPQILQIIHSQQNLKKISFEYTSNKNFLDNALLSLKDSNCSTTLRTTIFYFIDLKNIVNFKEAFEQLNALESIHFLYCTLNSDFIQQIINITRPFKLKSLLFTRKNFQISEISDESLQLLLQKSGNYIENFLFRFGSLSNNESKQRLFLESITRYCTKIKFLDFNLHGLDNQNIYSIFSLIENIRQNLNYLSIHVSDHLTSSIILLNLGQTLPFKLEYLRLTLFAVSASDLEIFLKNSQNTFIKKLLIKHTAQKESEDILPCIKEYIMKEKRVKCLAIRRIFNYFKSEELFSLKDEVKEFKSYGIQVQNHSSLIIQVFDFVKEIY